MLTWYGILKRSGDLAMAVQSRGRAHELANAAKYDAAAVVKVKFKSHEDLSACLPHKAGGGYVKVRSR